MKLPPLPESMDIDTLAILAIEGYDKDDMQAYALAVAEAVRAECVKVLEKQKKPWVDKVLFGFASVIDDAQKAIKSLEIES